MTIKRCHNCKLEKPVSEFNINRARKDGYNYICRICAIKKHSIYLAPKKTFKIIDGEIWKPIIGHENCYHISDFGRFKTLKRKAKRGNHVFTINEKITYGFDDDLGYKRACLTRNGKKEWFRIHELVGVHFLKNPDSKPLVHHKDRNKKNNHVSNLIFATYSENNQDAYDCGDKKPRPPENKNPGINVSFICKQIGISNYGAIMSRLHSGWELDSAIKTPIKKYNRKK